jgi:Cell division protein 48 (CDC48), domain 2./Cell division protein 48 (CDC48), N-terminal domain.
MSDDAGLKLTVRSAEKRDAGRGIARLPERVIRELGVLSGDTVVIEGEQATVAKVWPGGRDVADGTVLIDADTRANANVKVGQQVRVRKESVAEATKVTLQAPDELGTVDIAHDTIETAVKRGLRDRPVRAGEGVRIERLAGSRFVVTDTDPDGTVRVTESTAVTVSPITGGDADGESAGDKLRKTVDRATGGDAAETAKQSATGVTYEDIGGLDEELELVREMIELPSRSRRCSPASASTRQRASCCTAHLERERPLSPRRRQRG